MEARELKNSFLDFSDPLALDIINLKKHELTPFFKTSLKETAYQLLSVLEEKYPPSIDWSDVSVYTGTGGLVMLYMQFSTKLGDDSMKSNAISYLEKSLKNLKNKRITFLCGDAGLYAMGAVLYFDNDINKSKMCLGELLKMSRKVGKLDVEMPDEILYGRCGYLYSLLFVEKYLGEGTINRDYFKLITTSVIESGKRLAGTLKMAPLMYEWHGKKYLSAAHGIAGILFTLLQARKHLSHETLESFVKPTVDFLIDLQFPSGNFPSSFDSTSDRLVQWCHGAPGYVHCFALAYKVFEQEKYLNAALQCGEVTWNRGLLRKGYGICHGVSGNAYTFLVLYQLTKDIKHLYRAVKFAEFCQAYGTHGCRIPDRPFSMFEGMAGTIYFLVDLIEPLKSKFPAYHLEDF